ncbi:MAG: ferrochelatase [Gammaproteobacteria bacterium]|nr:ferrochelatase [Gammaproteobacteria bacterium]
MSEKCSHMHGAKEKLGILLVNLGSPDAPTASAVRRYLAQFLSDPRVIEANRFIWWLVLHGIILRIRPPRAAKAYQKVWTDNGSPLVHTSKLQTLAVQKKLEDRFRGHVIADLAMTYGNPSIKSGLEGLRKAGARRLLILPLYPQYSATTTAAVFDQVTDVLKNWRWLPDLRMINQYHDHSKYIAALTSSIKKHWAKNPRGELLLFSFHGIPQRYIDSGDPYFCHCQKTARLVAEKLELAADEWKLVFQSRFGREPWLQPYCSITLQELPASGIKNVDIICPGFAADCLETLEEIQMENKHLFIEAGGENFQYIPCLNDSEEHIEALSEILTAHMFGWPETMPGWDAGKLALEASKSRQRAIDMGARK